MSDVLLDIKQLNVRYRTAKNVLNAVQALDLYINPGETVALIGESGCGKTSLGKTIAGINHASDGEIRFEGVNLAPLSRRQWKPYRRHIQMVFQDPLSALDPRLKAGTAVDFPLRLHGGLSSTERALRRSELFRQVGLDEALGERLPHQLSGGQRQRLNIARALATNPKLIICDEPVSALDVSLQSQIIALLKTLQQQLGVAYLFISHDLAVVEDIADRIVVMYLGRIVEVIPKKDLWTHAAHPYTRLLLDAIPKPMPGIRIRSADTGYGAEPPSPYDNIPGCQFANRCAHARDVCRKTRPDSTHLGDTHIVACHFPVASSVASPALRSA